MNQMRTHLLAIAVLMGITFRSTGVAQVSTPQSTVPDSLSE